MIPGSKGQSTFHLIRYTYVSSACMYVMNTSHTWHSAPDFLIYALQVVRIFCRTDRAHIYAATIRVPWRAILYEYVFRSSTTYTHSVLYYTYALSLTLRLIQPLGVYTGTRTGNSYWPVRSIGRRHADEHTWLCLTSHIRVIFAVRLWYYCTMSILVSLRYVACSVSKSLCFHSNGQHSLPPP